MLILISQPKLSAIIITKNEEADLPRCLESLSFCDEIILVDSGSTDRTLVIAESFGCHIYKTDDWPGFGEQKQRALDKASGRWILSIDADEVITEELRDEILSVITNPRYSGYYISRCTNFLGKWMRHGGWSPDNVLRLAVRDLAEFDRAVLHEKLTLSGRCGRLKSKMLHFSYSSLQEVLSKQARYAIDGKNRILDSQRSTSLAITVVRSAWTFVRAYLIQLGFLDGRHGLIAAALKSQEVFWKYVAADIYKREQRRPSR